MNAIAVNAPRWAFVRMLSIGVLAVVTAAVVIVKGIDLWLTPDQQAQRLFREQKYLQAAPLFTDPAWRGTALYRAGEFEDAAQMFARVDSAQGQFNQGNAWLMHGQYEQAIRCYDAALQQQPDWQQAVDNRTLAVARAAMLSNEGGDMGDQRLGADKIVFDRKDNKGGQETEVSGDKAASDQQLQAMWLRRVQTEPADFLRSKFAYQQALQGAPE